MRYRREIDGLRAVAVLAVMFYHAGFDWASGGYIGVDVFFVLSGFLITSIIVSQQDAGTFSLVSFYERRVRRILPALFIMLAVTTPVAWFLLMPSQLKEFSQALVAIPLFVSNMLFWKQSGYFQTDNELNPLIHTWTLGVEEQFYLFFPVFVYLSWRLGKTRLFMLLVLATALSFGASEWASRTHPFINFFFAPTRAWELLTGSLLAFVATRSAIATRLNAPEGLLGSLLAAQVLSTVGVAGIVFATATYSTTTPFPGVYALVPVLGTALVIVFAVPSTLVYKILATRVLVSIGLVSYSLYLWHQPLFAFFRARYLTDINQAWFLALMVAALACASISYRFFERPARDRTKLRKRTVFLSATTVGVLFVALGIAFNLADVKGRQQQLFESQGITVQDQRGGAAAMNALVPDGVLAEPFDRDARHRILLVGDSLSRDMTAALVLNEDLFAGVSVRRMRFLSECFRDDFPVVVGARNCETDRSSLRFSGLLEEATMILIVDRFDNPRAFEGFADVVQSYFADYKDKLVIVGRGPEFLPSTPELTYAFISRNPGAEIREINQFLYTRINPDVYRTNERLLALSEEHSVRFEPRIPIVCSTDLESCEVVSQSGLIRYYDEDHWSLSGAAEFGAVMYDQGWLGLSDITDTE